MLVDGEELPLKLFVVLIQSVILHPQTVQSLLFQLSLSFNLLKLCLDQTQLCFQPSIPYLQLLHLIMQSLQLIFQFTVDLLSLRKLDLEGSTLLLLFLQQILVQPQLPPCILELVLNSLRVNHHPLQTILLLQYLLLPLRGFPLHTALHRPHNQTQHTLEMRDYFPV